MSWGQPTLGSFINVLAIPAGILDIVLAFFILSGKGWARTLMLVRLIIGAFVWGIVYLLMGEHGSVLTNTGVILALILLLTGKSNRLRTVGSATLAVAAFFIGIGLGIFTPTINIPEVPASYDIPSTFSTYKSEGFFSISYPPDWKPVQGIVAKAEEGMKQYLKDMGMESQAKDVHVVFLGGKIKEDGKLLSLSVTVEPSQLWPLETLVDNSRQLIRKNTRNYVEHSMVKTTIAGKKAIIITYQANDGDSGLTGYSSGFVSGSRFLWAVTCAGNIESFTSDRQTFDRIIRSLKVEY